MPVIRVAFVDDHYAVRLGLEAALDAQPGMTPVGAAACAADVAPLLYRTAPDVLIVDYRLPDEDGLSVCLQVEAGVVTPARLVHSAFADEWLTVLALIAGADGIVHKGATGLELADAIRTVASGRSALPALDSELVTAAADAIEPEDVAILGMLLHRVPRPEICDALRISPTALRERRAGMLAALRSPAAG
jgi:DNA-binding NarL/FixJ family response regulator